MAAEDDEEWVRLVICLTCHSVDEAVDFQGDPGADLPLEMVTRKHMFPNGDSHEFAKLHRMLARQWNKEEIRQDVLKRLWAQQGYTGMEPWVYANVNTLKSDAYKCWTSRLKPKRCADFHDESKRLTPPTRDERKDAGLGKYRTKKLAAGQVRFLCDYCVCRMQVENEINLKNPSL